MEFIVADEKWMGKWDNFVSNQFSGHFMQSLAWGRFRETSGWEQRYFLAIQKNQIKGAALVLSKTFPIIKKLIFYLPRGPVIEPGNGETLLFLLKNIGKYVEDNNGIFLRVDPYLEEAEEYDSIFNKAGYKKINRKWSYWNCPKFIFWLRLDEGVDNILKRMKRKKRYEIRSAYKKGVEFIRGGEKDLQDFHTLMVETADRKNIGAHDFGYYENILKILGDSVTTQLFLAKYKGETAAAGISLVYGKRAWLLYLASSEKHLHLSPNRALQWEMIKWAFEQGCKVYDFRGTATDDPPNPSDPGYGVYKFKKSFGPDFIRTVGYYDYVVNNMLYKPFRVFEDNFLPFFVNKAKKLIEFRKKVLN